MIEYDTICKRCGNVEQEEPCEHCEGYGYLLLPEGFALIEFLKRRGFAIPMSPRAEDDLANMLGD